MRVTVDLDMCASTGGCVHQAPTVFKILDDGMLYILQEEPGEELRAQVTAAEELCPTGAIAIVD
jgi:ferredoxin